MLSPQAGLIKSAIFLVITSLYSETMLSSPSCNRPVSLGWEEWVPYAYKSMKKSGKPDYHGLDMEVMKRVFEHMGCRLTFTEVPWIRHLDLLKAGSIDLATAASKTSERSEYAYFSESYREETMVLFVRNGESKKYTFSTFRQMFDSEFTLGAVRGYFYGKEFDRFKNSEGYKQKLTLVQTQEQEIKMLLAGRLQGILGDPVTVINFLKKSNKTNLVEQHPMRVNSDYVYVMFSKKSTSRKLVNSFNKSLQALRKSGEYRKILDKYLTLK